MTNKNKLIISYISTALLTITNVVCLKLSYKKINKIKSELKNKGFEFHSYSLYVLYKLSKAKFCVIDFIGTLTSKKLNITEIYGVNKYKTNLIQKLANYSTHSSTKALLEAAKKK